MKRSVHHAVMAFVALAAASLPLVAGCDDTTDPPPDACSTLAKTFAVGDPNGSSDPFGAKAAGQARVGRIKAADVKQPAHGRQQIQDGDFVLANDKIAVVVEDISEVVFLADIESDPDIDFALKTNESCNGILQSSTEEPNRSRCVRLRVDTERRKGTMINMSWGFEDYGHTCSPFSLPSARRRSLCRLVQYECS